jgi:mannan endo-1,4-beta-mannosidase
MRPTWYGSQEQKAPRRPDDVAAAGRHSPLGTKVSERPGGRVVSILVALAICLSTLALVITTPEVVAAPRVDSSRGHRPAASPAPTPSQSPTPTPSPAPTPSPSPTPLPPAATGFVSRTGTALTLNGLPYRFTGVNAYEAATYWGVNAGCGQMLTDQDLANLFAQSLKSGQVVRFWAFQALATNYTTKQRDWTGIDRVINAAAAYGVKVIPALSGESGGCDDNHWKDVSWYSGGYMNVYDDLNQWPASTPVSFWQYMHEFLNRYSSNPTIAMIELVSEPGPADYSGGPCSESDAKNTLRSFYDTVGVEAKKIDPNHLFESGQQGVGQCGQQDQGCTTSSWTSCAAHDYEYVLQSNGVDVASYHDYGSDAIPVPNYLAESIPQAAADGKPLIVGEAGIDAQANLSGCMALSDRANNINFKVSGQFTAGVSGVVIWNWVPGGAGTACIYNFIVGDPVLPVLQQYS